MEKIRFKFNGASKWSTLPWMEIKNNEYGDPLDHKTDWLVEGILHLKFMVFEPQMQAYCNGSFNDHKLYVNSC